MGMLILAEKFKAGLTRLSLSGKGETHSDPLTNIKRATRWLDSLPGGDAFQSQNEILNELKRFNENLLTPMKVALKARLAVLMLLDEKSQDMQDTLVQQYLRTSRMSRTVESQLWHAVNSLYWEICRGYHIFVMDFSRNPRNYADDTSIPLVVLRAIRTFGLLLKWRAIRYLQTGHNIWLGLHQIYRVAETHGFHQNKLLAYPERCKPSSCEETYLHILMLDLANSGTLYPRQLHLVDQWLANWRIMLTLESTLYPQQHHFAIDLSADHGARRVRNPALDKPMRYWATAKIAHQLDIIQLALREGTPPVRLGLTEDSRIAESIELLDHLQRCWAPITVREQRRAPRDRVKHMVEISHGFTSIASQINTVDEKKANLYGDNLMYMEAEDVAVYGFVTERTRNHTTQTKKTRPGLLPEIERWIMHDESAMGYSAIVETRDKSWLRIGALVATKPREAAAWQLGVVRRLFRLDDESSSVGIETIGETLHIVTLKDRKEADYTVGGHSVDATLPFVCLWLAGNEGRATMVMDPAQYQIHKLFEVQGMDNINWIELGEPVERGEGWVRVTVNPSDVAK